MSNGPKLKTMADGKEILAYADVFQKRKKDGSLKKTWHVKCYVCGYRAKFPDQYDAMVDCRDHMGSTHDLKLHENSPGYDLIDILTANVIE